MKLKAWEKIINHYTPEGTRESHPSVHALRHPRLGKPRRGLQIMDTRMGFPCPFRSVVIDSISLYIRTISPKVGQKQVSGGKSVFYILHPLQMFMKVPITLR